MLIKCIWDSIVFDDYDFGYKERINVYMIFFAVFLSLLFFPLDVLFSPIEIIAFIIYKIIDKED